MNLCDCHGEEMAWRKDASYEAGGRFRCAVKWREISALWQHATPGKQREYRGRSYAAQLARGEQIAHQDHHHSGMAELKAQLGDPRPAGLTLSLVNYDSPGAYWGYTRIKGERIPYRLSVDPDDYAWETQAENNARR